jgi:hypothetical protein
VGGFGLTYEAGSEQVLFVCDPGDPGGGLPGQPIFYRVDDDRQLLVWTDAGESGRVRAAVIDASAAPALTVGAVVEFEASVFADISAVRLDDDNWLMYYREAPMTFVPDHGMSYQRFSIAGTTITAAVYEEHSSWWEQDIPAIPDAFYEGHVWAGSISNVTYAVDGAPSGIDIDHIIVEATLAWIDSGVAHSEPKVAIIDLTTSLPVASYNAAALGYTPGSLAAFGTPAEGPAYAEPGVSYRVGVDGSSDPVVALVEATSSTTLAATVTDLPSSFISDNGSLSQFSRSPDGVLWTWFGERTFHSWTPADPIGGHWTIYSIVGATATPHSYSFENFAGAGAANTVPAGGSGLMVGGYSWLTTDTHMRMEGSEFVDLAPHQTIHTLAAYGGTPVDGYIVMAYSHGASPASAYIAVAKEIPLDPIASFAFHPDVISTRGSKVTFDGTQTQDLHDTDYYWHPVVGWHWEYDDGKTEDAVMPVTLHLYAKKSTTHVAGSQVIDEPSPAPAHWGDVGYYLPVLIVTDTLGHSSAASVGGYLFDYGSEDRVQVTVDSLIDPVRQRQIPLATRQRQHGAVVRQRQIPR